MACSPDITEGARHSCSVLLYCTALHALSGLYAASSLRSNCNRHAHFFLSTFFFVFLGETSAITVLLLNSASFKGLGMFHRLRWLMRQLFRLLSWKCPIRISDGTPPTLTDGFCGFDQHLQANVGVEP
jgi:hypothetical protein